MFRPSLWSIAPARGRIAIALVGRALASLDNTFERQAYNKATGQLHTPLAVDSPKLALSDYDTPV
jgi:hypothetical protein